jgi:hypothetical protein
MENTNEKDFTELSPNEVRDLQLGMRHFFINYPPEELKEVIWDLYRGWVYNSAEYVGKEEITNMLLFYEAIHPFMNDVYNYCQYLDRTVLKK